MRVGTLNTSLHLVGTKKSSQTSRKTRHNPDPLCWMDQISRAENLSLVKHGVHSAQPGPEDRAARVEQLRAQIKAGCYVIDSMALANNLLKNEIGLLSVHQQKEES